MRHKSYSRRYSINKQFAIFFPLFTLIFLVTIIYSYYYFSISQIEIISSTRLSGIRGLENIKNNNLLLLSNNKIKTIILNSNPQFKTVKVEKDYPNKIKLMIETDNPLIALKVNQGYLLLDINGKVIAKNKENPVGLPKLSYYQQLDYESSNPGDKIDLKDILTALHFVKKISDLGLNAISVDINGLDMIRLNLKDKTIIFTTKKDINIQDYQLETILREFKIQGTDFADLDLRFDKPVIKPK